MHFSATQQAREVRAGRARPEDLTEQALQEAQRLEHLGALISRRDDEARADASEVAARVARGEHLPLAGVPVVIKDNLNLQGTHTTCGSRALGGYVSPYTATAVQRLRAAGAVIIGKANMDEFAMGSSTESGAFGRARNPWDPARVPGGSSGGSAVAVASGMVPLSLGSDTGGSVRQPAAFTGVYGFKPTYGRVSRYGLVAYASSLDQVGPFARHAEDLATVMDVIAGHDPRDGTSLQAPPAFTSALGLELRGKRFAFIRESLEGNTAGVMATLERTRALLEGAGATVAEVSLPTLKYGIAAYYLIATPEASSNLARYDGMVYSHRNPDVPEMVQSMSVSRGEAFGAEVKRRILMGTYALSSGYYDAYYSKAMRVRRLIAQEFAGAFEQFDALITPTSPFPAFRRGERSQDPLAMYAADVDTVPVNLAGVPAISVPMGTEQVEGVDLPIGMQFIAAPLADEQLVGLAYALEGLTEGEYLRLPPQ
ncbi:Asp-tRNA(Asn)/Glu-tRNA(Gln) amidotransferase subunit GatA [Deinococcus maricopensis]|uniref:Glutamyl-tRNA(Gln) amidotransferase subunit A n=1 Tax=Deinococcus maricopensis (strain DSM 21211 / LMG 22137 / NRRL B-23946 / LB-34) TaxID=709986 RepID=E8U6Z0_DEIML|nr:Asp-tRNA(Asn)/Glu-tRNA(Gln) amidotransferase subunit GatA [Deinococcus maricopensis]ADV66829.1 Glutamyl-tRNA(Gln) amidotransferase subunit A [Deinococcus maricopensis DSM 21211]